MNQTNDLYPRNDMSKRRTITINANTGYDLNLFLTKYTLKTFINKNGDTNLFGEVEVILSNTTPLDVAEMSNDLMREINGYKTVVLSVQEDKSLLVTPSK